MTYTQILCLFIVFTTIAVYLAYYFNTRIKYVPFEEQKKKIEVKELQSAPDIGSDREDIKNKKGSGEVIES